MKGNKELFVTLGILVAVFATCHFQEAKFYSQSTTKHLIGSQVARR